LTQININNGDEMKKYRTFDDNLKAIFEAQVKGRKIKRIDMNENCSALGYFSGGSGVAFVTTRTAFTKDELLDDENGRIYEIKEINKYKNLADIPQNIELSESKVDRLIHENMIQNRPGYTVLILKRI
jgi:hypothetical protein